MALRRINKELKDLEAELEDTNNQLGFVASPIDRDDLFKWTAEMTGKQYIPYAQGKYFMEIKFPPDYPFKPMTIKFFTKIYNSSVHEDFGQIYLDILKDNWSPALTITKV